MTGEEFEVCFGRCLFLHISHPTHFFLSKTDIFIGNIYYQRLRHMVSDKFQVRTTGPVNPVTRQPVKVRCIELAECPLVLHAVHIKGSQAARRYSIRRDGA